MAIYQYRCPTCGVFEVSLAMGSAEASQSCARCGEQAPRRYSAPHVNRTPAALGEALTRAEKSRDEPEVVTEPPPRPHPRRIERRDPRWSRLPKW